MRKLLILTGLLILFLSSSIFATEVHISKASRVAENFYNFWSGYQTTAKASETLEIKTNNTLVYYVFNFSTGGYVIISADDETTPVLSYAFKGKFIRNDPNLPQAYSDLLQSYSDQILIIKENDLHADKQIKEKWDNYYNNNFVITKGTQDVSPLLDIDGIAWDQGCYYNTQCPSDADGDCEHVPTGCVATAMAQIMRFYKYPDHGTGTHTYTDSNYGSQTANFETATYIWNNMPGSVYTNNTEVAEIMYHCGVSVDMSYSTNGSGAYIYGYVQESFVNYFNYDSEAMYAYRENYTDEQWKDLIYNDIDNNWPVFYSGSDSEGEFGHAFVCDGYQGTDNFHFNWGWSGYYNSYNTIDELIPGGTGTGGGNGDFSYNHQTVFKVHPIYGSTDLNADFYASPTYSTVGSSIDFTDNSVGTYSTWNWDFGDGESSSSQNPSHTYNSIGSYTVSLTISDGTNNNTETKTSYITINDESFVGWIEQASSFSTASRGIFNISIVDENIVWATGYDGTGTADNIQEFTKTTNGGETWVEGSFDLGDTDLGIGMINAISASTAWVVAYPNGTGQTGGIWKTTNNGSSWTRQSSATYNDASSFTNVVFFWDANNGFCQGDPINGDFELYTTTNGGTTWAVVSEANIPDPLSGEYGYVNNYEAVENHIWFSTNKGRLYHSSDKGYTFEVFDTPISDFQDGSFSFKNTSSGIIVDSDGNIYKTSNSGETWNQITTTGTVFTHSICWVEGTDVVFTTGAAETASGSSISNDGGLTWTGIDTEQHLCIDFIDIQTGWSGWFNVDANNDGMWKWNNTSTADENTITSNISLEIYPNPAKDFINIKFDNSQKISNLQILNITGQIIYESNILPSDNEFVINTEFLKSGIYILSLNSEGINYYSKFIIE